MSTDFTPLFSFTGGALIGLAAVLLMTVQGRVFGATGILAGAISSKDKQETIWRVCLIAGMVSAPIVFQWITGAFPEFSIPVTTPSLIIGGLIVGFGVHLGSGCTSGHGICGNARLSPRSMIATLTFMITGFIAVFVIRHLFGV